MKFYVTKYALSCGIEEWEAEDPSLSKFNSPQFLKGPAHASAWGDGVNWHRTKESAIKKAEEMRLKKIESLKKQIRNLEALRFTI